jgi:hypothetical protein
LEEVVHSSVDGFGGGHCTFRAEVRRRFPDDDIDDTERQLLSPDMILFDEIFFEFLISLNLCLYPLQSLLSWRCRYLIIKTTPVVEIVDARKAIP